MENFKFNVTKTSKKTFIKEKTSIKEKACKVCNIIKPVSEFSKADTKDGYRNQCKACVAKQVRDKVKNGDVYDFIRQIYNHQKSSSKYRNHPAPAYTYDELCYFCKKNNIDVLFEKYIKADRDSNIAPSIDRIDSSRPYTLDNIRLITWQENRSINHIDMRNGINSHWRKPVVGIKLDDPTIRIKFDSAMAAQRKLNISATRIGSCCRGNIKSAGGYTWSYINPDDINTVGAVPVDKVKPKINANRIPIYAINAETLDKSAAIKYDSISAAAIALKNDVKFASLITTAKNKYNKTALGYFWTTNINEFDPSKTTARYTKPITKTRRKIKITNISTNEYEIFNSVSSAVKATKLHKARIIKLAESNSVFEGYKFEVIIK